MTGNLILLCFILTQVLDGVATLHGISLFGLPIEGNLFLRFLMERFGPVPVVVCAKALSVVGGAYLYSRKSYFLLTVLTVFYILCVLIPWMNVLS
jgi:hypothetical protein